jgi:hypothetical protein
VSLISLMFLSGFSLSSYVRLCIRFRFHVGLNALFLLFF